MATTRINAVSATATTFAGDDFLPIDGNVNATRRILVTSLFASASAIGSVTPAAGTFTSLSGTNINGTLGATTPSSVAATTGGFSGVLDVGAGGFTQGGYGLLNINGSSGGMVKFGAATVLKGSIYGNVGGITYDAAGALVHNFYTNSVSRGTITDTGLNGMAIGATSPSTIAGTTGSFTGNVSTTQGGATTVLANGIIGTTTNTALQLYANNSSRMQINANGDVIFTGSVTGMTGLAVTGTISATGVASFLGLKAQKATATSGFVTVIDEGANTYNVLGSRNNADSAYLPLVIRGTTVTLGATSDIVAVSSTGAAITGTLSATGLATFTSNYSSTLAGSINMTSNIPLITFQNSGSGANRNFMLANGYSNGGIMTLAISGTAGGAATTILSEWSATGLAVTGTLSATGAITGSTTLAVGSALASGCAFSVTGEARVYSSGANDDENFSLKNGTQQWNARINGSDQSFSIRNITGGSVDVLKVTSGGAAITGTLSSSNTFSTFNNSTQELWRSVWDGGNTGGISAPSGRGLYLTTSGTASTQGILIDGSGNVGIGTTGPTAKLDVVGALLVTQSASNTASATFTSSHATTPTGAVISFSGGTPNDATQMFLTCGDTTNTKFQLRSNGGLGNYSANNANLSDRRLKENFVSFTESASEIINRLEVTQFNYIGQKRTVLGVVAQQVETVAPWLVESSGFGETPKDGIPYKSIYQTDLEFLVIKALQEQNAELQSLRGRLAALESK